MGFPSSPPTPTQVVNAVQDTGEQIVDAGEQVVDAVVETVTETAGDAADAAASSPLNPTGAIVQGGMMVESTVGFVVDNGRQVAGLVNEVVTEITEIAHGAIEDAAQHVEAALTRSMVIVIGFLANLVGLSGVAGRVQTTIKRMQAAIDKQLGIVVGESVGVVKDASNRFRTITQGTAGDAERGRQAIVDAIHRVARKPAPKKGGPAPIPGKPSPDTSGNTQVDLYRLAARFGKLERAVGRLEATLQTRGPKFAQQTIAVRDIRLALQRGGTTLAAQAAIAKPRLASPQLASPQLASPQLLKSKLKGF
jgi:hypothetical protein